MRFGFAEFQENALHLGRKDINTPDDQHVVAAAGNPLHPHMGASAGAFFGVKRRDVPGAVTYNRNSFLLNCGQDQFPLLPVRQGLTGIGVDNFSNKMVLKDMAAAFGRTFHGNSRTHYFTEPVNIQGRNGELLL
ncbi:MAG: hypothetical protein BWY80_01419 [Firmicutes bacterium ADurb.Bin456]|nr:MAG: hypothetical protein BWY80_01419 [Firmicutes bacterium ADurb.Bin456]